MQARVLIAGGDGETRNGLSALLRRQGYVAASAESAADVLSRGGDSFDLILLDVARPEPEGWDLLLRLRKGAATASVPVVVLTAGDGPDEILRAYASGATYSLRNTCRSDELLRGLRLALRDRSRRD